MRIILTLLILAAGVGALYWQQMAPLGVDQKRTKIFEDYSLDTLNSANRLSFARGRNENVVLEKTTDGWVVVDYLQTLNYAADTNLVFSVLHGLLEATLVEEKTRKPEYYERLGVQDPTEIGASNILLKLNTDTDEWRLIVGSNSNEVKNGQYIRLPDDEVSWLINRQFSLPVDKLSWLDKEVVNLLPDQLQEIVVENPRSTDIVALMREAADKEYTLKATQQEPTNKPRIAQLTGVVENLQFKDIKPRSETPIADDAIKISFTTFEGLKVTLRCFHSGTAKDTLFALQAEAREGASLEVGAQVKRLNAIYGDWLFHVPEHLFTAVDMVDVDITPQQAPETVTPPPQRAPESVAPPQQTPEVVTPLQQTLEVDNAESAE